MTPIPAYDHPPVEHERVLILPPSEADGALTQSVLTRAGIPSAVCPGVVALVTELERGCGALLLTDDAIVSDEIHELIEALSRQPVWSDLPVVAMVAGGADSTAAAFAMERFGNVMLLEYPARINTLVSAVRVALRERRRQYQTKKYQEELLQQAEYLWRSNKELEQFAYVSSHDLKEPLRKIISYAELLNSRYRSQIDATGDRYLENITQSALRMNILIEDLLAFSRLTRAEAPMQKVDLNKVMEEVTADLEMSIVESGAKVNVAKLPTIYARPLQMHQLLQNLVGNGLKYRAAAPPTIDVWSEQKGERVTVYVRDNGIGIESEYHDKIFNVFSRLHPRDKYPGTGIGLAICKKIAESHGGTIGVTSQLGQGSTFTVTLPQGLKAGGPAPGPALQVHGDPGAAA